MTAGGWLRAVLRSAAVAIVAMLLAPAAGASFDFELRVEMGDGEPVAQRRLDLELGVATRVTQALPSVEPRQVLILDLTVTHGDARVATVAVHGRLGPPAGQPGELQWTARTFVLASGASDALVFEHALPPVKVRVTHAPPFEVGQAVAELPAVAMSTTFLIHERTAAGDRLVEQRRVRLRGPEPVEVQIHSRDGVTLTLQLTPLVRDDDGAEIDLVVISRDGRSGQRVVRSDRLALGWDDRVRLDGLTRGDDGLWIDIKPER